MATLRALSTIYLVCALAFTTAIVLDRNPALNAAAQHDVALVIDTTRDTVVTPSVDFAKKTGARVADAIWGKPAPKAAPSNDMASAKPQTPPAPVLAQPAPRPVAQPAPQVAQAPPARPVAPPAQTDMRPPPLHLVPVPETAPPTSAAPDIAPAELARVTLRLRGSLTREMYDNFSLFLYVSKAGTGPWAQHLFVFKKEASGDLALLHAWPASTGREKDEMAPNGTHQPSFTPRGYYELDPDRMYKVHYSGQWHEPMPHAMFFNWEHDGLQTGLAIHGAVGLEIAQLGSRASAGCIRISPDNAAMLFTLIRADYRGLAPRFAYDRRTATMSNDGLFMHDAAGNLKMAEGYKVLVFVEDYGGDNVVAAVF